MEQDIISYLEQFLNTQYGELYTYTASTDDFIEIYATGKLDKSARYCLLRIGIDVNTEQIYLSNIFIPLDMKHNGIGKKMIYVVYTAAKKYDYDVFVVQLTDAFREQLLNRGALETEEDGTLQIIEGTNLF